MVRNFAPIGWWPIDAFPHSVFQLAATSIIVVKDYAYANIDFRGDLDLPIPLGTQWTDAGKNCFFNIFTFLMYFVMYYEI